MKRSDSWNRGGLDFLAVAGRWLLGGLFIYMGLKKALRPEVFLKLVEQYQIVNQPVVLNSIAATLPWFEVFCGVLLLAGVAVRGVAFLVAGMLIPFTAVVLKRALEIAGAKGIALCAVKFDCGCGLGEVFACHKAMENSALILISCSLWAGWGGRFSLRYSLFKQQHRPVEPVPGEKALNGR